MERKRSLNELGVWLSQELDRRNIQRNEFANLINTTPQNLSDILRGERFSRETLKRWEIKFREELRVIDEKAETAWEKEPTYQTICSTITIEGTSCLTYGLQMLVSTADHYLVEDEIRDISLQPDVIMKLEQQCNTEKVSSVHFRDVVADYVGSL